MKREKRKPLPFTLIGAAFVYTHINMVSVDKSRARGLGEFALQTHSAVWRAAPITNPSESRQCRPPFSKAHFGKICSPYFLALHSLYFSFPIYKWGLGIISPARGLGASSPHYKSVGDTLRSSFGGGVSLVATSDQRRCLWTPRAFEKARPKLLICCATQTKPLQLRKPERLTFIHI